MCHFLSFLINEDHDIYAAPSMDDHSDIYNYCKVGRKPAYEVEWIFPAASSLDVRASDDEIGGSLRDFILANYDRSDLVDFIRNRFLDKGTLPSMEEWTSGKFNPQSRKLFIKSIERRTTDYYPVGSEGRKLAKDIFKAIYLGIDSGSPTIEDALASRAFEYEEARLGDSYERRIIRRLMELLKMRVFAPDPEEFIFLIANIIYYRKSWTKNLVQARNSLLPAFRKYFLE
jgi:hypothetical protein